MDWILKIRKLFEELPGGKGDKVTDSCEDSISPSRSESVPDRLKSTDGTAESKIDMQRADSGYSRTTRGRTLVFAPEVAITPSPSCVNQHRNGKRTAINVPVHYRPLFDIYILIHSFILGLPLY